MDAMLYSPTRGAFIRLFGNWLRRRQPAETYRYEHYDPR